MPRVDRQLSVPGGEVTTWRIDPESPSGRTPVLFLHGGPGGSCDGFAVFETPVTRAGWLLYADPALAPLRRSRGGSYMPVSHWLLYDGR